VVRGAAANDQMLTVGVEGSNRWAEGQTDQLDGEEDKQQLIDPGGRASSGSWARPGKLGPRARLANLHEPKIIFHWGVPRKPSFRDR